MQWFSYYFQLKCLMVSFSTVNNTTRKASTLNCSCFLDFIVLFCQNMSISLLHYVWTCYVHKLCEYVHCCITVHDSMTEIVAVQAVSRVLWLWHASEIHQHCRTVYMEWMVNYLHIFLAEMIHPINYWACKLWDTHDKTWHGFLLLQSVR